MGDYIVTYPKRVNLLKNITDIRYEDLHNEELYIIVKSSVDEITKILKSEGFRRLRLFEHKKPSQIGSGFTKMLNKPWEMHVRLLRLKDGLIGIHAEVEISRKYLQHIVSSRAPIIYEMINLLKKYNIEYKIWNSKLNKYVTNVIEDYKIRLKGYKLPLPWIPMVIVGGFFGIWGLLRMLGLVPLWPFY